MNGRSSRAGQSRRCGDTCRIYSLHHTAADVSRTPKEHYSIVDSFTARGDKPIMAFSV